MVWKSKKDYELRLAQNINSDPKGFFSYASANRKSRSSIGPIEDSSGHLRVNNIEMAEVLNKFFSSVFLKSGKVDDMQFNSDQGTINTVNFTRERVLKAIQRIKPNKAPGPDDIYPRVLVEAAEVISGRLTHIFAKSIEEDTVPKDRKMANVIPIYKREIERMLGITDQSVLHQLLVK